MQASGYANYDGYRPGNAYFICDRCSQRHRRSAMITEWTGLKVDRKCLDPRPPQMTPPDIYPEGIPFFDARPPQDNPDRLTDDTTLQSIGGGFMVTPPGQLYPNGQNQQPGAISPSSVEQTPIPLGPNVLEDDTTFITGFVGSPFLEPGTGPIPPPPPPPSSDNQLDFTDPDNLIWAL